MLKIKQFEGQSDDLIKKVDREIVDRKAFQVDLGTRLEKITTVLADIQSSVALNKQDADKKFQDICKMMGNISLVKDRNISNVFNDLKNKIEATQKELTRKYDKKIMTVA